jgi:hypothetical protein
MKTRSAKNKGQRLAKYVRERILSTFSTLSERDVTVTPSGVPGADIGLSKTAFEYFPFATECKNQEALNIWKALEQAHSHQKGFDELPLVVFKRNRTDVFCALNFDDFLDLISRTCLVCQPGIGEPTQEKSVEDRQV